MLKSEPSSPAITYRAAPHTALPASIEIMSDGYIQIFFFGNAFLNIPQSKPYAASSNAMETAMGYIGGAENRTLLMSDAINPTAKP